MLYFEEVWTQDSYWKK